MSTLKDIAQLAQLLPASRNVREIKASQGIIGELGNDFNHIMFVQKQGGVYYYTDKNLFRANITGGKNEKLPTYVTYEGCDYLYEIK